VETQDLKLGNIDTHVLCVAKGGGSKMGFWDKNFEFNL
jgi:hypothetical protein